MSASTPRQPNPEGNDFAQYFPHQEPIQYGVNVPAQSGSSCPDPNLPNAMDPMGAIEARGEVYRNLKTSYAPWWAVITSWLVLGLPGFFLGGLAIAFGLQQLHVLLEAFTDVQGWPTFWSSIFMLLLSLLLFGMGSLLLLIPMRSTLIKLDRRQAKR
ncbi:MULTISPECIES: hypothetical protein [Cyanophyceae]|uniref:hypothetical protein n=1 Tax=Cyanophyceae TaxID=3028117 RepID=UPI001683669E|nr:MULTISPECIES: hypothetical protein [Cyanophyceae]MBD1917990.1 hypothetical protein [Phormidium sp. FACHB-77]MBD2029238.1 hypothetical protein [Phormidium sp. FACHB-322]MBD2049770.1 hypothetical protein [Leptolyngbya sp. FACHB-60]